MHHIGLCQALSGSGLPWYNILALSVRLEHRPQWVQCKHLLRVRPTLSPCGEGPGNRPPRGLVILPALLIRRTQERFRTRPRLGRLGSLEGIIFHKAGQVGTEEVPLHRHATVTGVDTFGETLLVLLAADTHLGQRRSAGVECDHAPASTFSLAGQDRQKQPGSADTDGSAKLLLPRFVG